MQFLPAIKPPLTRDPKVIAREAPAGAHLPYARHIDDATIETRDGLLCQTIKLGGLLFETAKSVMCKHEPGIHRAENAMTAEHYNQIPLR